MVCLIKNRSKFCKKILHDIWGNNLRYLKLSKVIHFRVEMRKNFRARRRYYKRPFNFSLGRKIKFRWKKRFKKKYLRPKLLFNYFLIVKKRLFLKYAYIAKRKHGYFLRNYLTLIEGRLFMMIYRSNFVSNIFKLKYIISHGVFLVNWTKRYHPNYNVRVGDIIQVDYNYTKLLSNDLIYRLKYFKAYRGRIYKYMFINHKFMFIFFLRAPKYKEIKYPLRLDIYIGSSLYFL